MLYSLTLFTSASLFCSLHFSEIAFILSGFFLAYFILYFLSLILLHLTQTLDFPNLQVLHVLKALINFCSPQILHVFSTVEFASLIFSFIYNKAHYTLHWGVSFPRNDSEVFLKVYSSQMCKIVNSLFSNGLTSKSVKLYTFTHSLNILYL